MANQPQAAAEEEPSRKERERDKTGREAKTAHPNSEWQSSNDVKSWRENGHKA